MKSPQSLILRSPRGFSLLEVLLATFILGIGLIMVASVFPVGANWTRESTQDSVGQTIALNAVATIESHYNPNSLDLNHKGTFATGLTSSTLTGLPGFTGNNGIPVAERCYQFGSSAPYPASNPTACLYYWTAVGRQTLGSGGASHDIFIFVLRKGETTQTFTSAPPLNLTADTAAPNPNYFPSTFSANLEPILVSQAYSAGTWNASTQAVNSAVPPIGFVGVGATSGTVFRQTLDFTKSPPAPTPLPSLVGGNPPTEQVIFAPAADGTAGSPLIYVYQTTLPY